MKVAKVMIAALLLVSVLSSCGASRKDRCPTVGEKSWSKH